MIQIPSGTTICSNIYECKAAVNYPYSSPIAGNYSCHICKSDFKVGQAEASVLVSACKICSKITGIDYNTKVAQMCLTKNNGHCPFCNIEYLEPDKNEDKLLADYLRVFMGSKSIDEMIETTKTMILKEKNDSEILGCSGVCKLTENVLSRMDDNIKKEKFKFKITTVFENMYLLQDCYNTLKGKHLL